MNSLLYGLLFISCFAGHSLAYDASKPLGDFLVNLPHTHIPQNISDLDTDFAVTYVKGLVPVIGTGIALAALSVVIGIIYGIIKICCCICCSSNGDEEGYGKTFSYKKRLIPFIVYICFFLWIFTGCVMGFVSNNKFTQGTGQLSGAIEDVGSDAVNLGNTLLGGLTDVVDSIPGALNNLIAQINDLPEIADEVDTLGDHVNGTTQQVGNLENQVHNINTFTSDLSTKIATFTNKSSSGNLTILSSLTTSLDSINAQSSQVISSVVSLTDQLSSNLLNVLNGTVGQLNSSLADVTADAHAVIEQSQGFVNKTQDFVDQIDVYVGQVRDYDLKRQQGLAAVYAVVMVTSSLGILGWMLKKGLPFNVVTGFAFFFSFLLWLSGSVHLLFGIVLSDLCPIIDSDIHTFIDTQIGGTPANAINGCLGNTSLFDSLNLTSSFNLSNIFDYNKDLGNFTGFINDYNFSTVDNYFNSMDTLKTYNLTNAANNITVATFGWNQSYVYQSLDAFNQLTDINPYYKYFTLDNYTSYNENDYNPSVRADYNKAFHALNDTVYFNQTIYDSVAQAKTMMYGVQTSLTGLTNSLDGYKLEYDNIHHNITDLATVKVANALNIIKAMQDNITHFFTLGDCSFVGTEYRLMLNAICEVMLPSIELLMASQYMIAVGCIPAIILCEVLAHRIRHAFYDEKISPDKDEYDYDSRPEQTVQMATVRVQE